MLAEEAEQTQPVVRKMRLGSRLMACGLVVAVAAAGGLALLYHTADEPSDAELRADLVKMLQEAAPRERLEAEITAALDRDAPEQAEEYIEVADLIGAPIDPALRARWGEETSGWRAAARTTRRAAKGFVTGEGEDPVGVAAALASDLTVVGDVRDLAGQASRMLKGEAVDELTLGLSLAGVAMTAGTVVTAGGALPAKAGISLAKLARKTGKLTARFQAELGRMVAKSVDLPAFRQAVRDIPWYRADELAAAGRRHAATVNTTEVGKVLSSVGAISRGTSPARALAVLRHIDDVKDVQRAERAATLLGKPVSGALLLTGKKVLTTVARRATMISVAMMGALFAAAFGVLSFLMGVGMALFTVLRIRRMVRWVFRRTPPAQAGW